MSEQNKQSETPTGELSLRVLAMPADTNPAGFIFGGWAVGQMDMAGAMHAASYTGTRVVTVAIDTIKFHKPIHIGDEVSCYTSIARVGRTSLSLLIQIWVRRARSGQPIHVTEGVFTYVALDDKSQPVEIKRA
ncbi:MAG: acyl-CoA thioesterase [Alphaproteobacteria bacterium]|nr:acyl-CoA thioesterase [Alphaproteobacteria bacterium]PHY00760.1 MAG: acyl-CoA thioesterase [Rhodospirillaceae bacterium]